MKIYEVLITEPFKAEVRSALIPDTLDPDSVRIRTEVSAVSSGTELAVYTGAHQWLSDPNYPSWRFPFRCGYSSCGIVEAVGTNVRGLKPGDRVATAGTHASHVVRRASGCWGVGSEVPSEVAAFGCIARYGFGAAARVPTTLGRCVIVQGLGIVGQFALRTFIAGGAHPVFGLDPHENRRKLAMLGGASATFDPNDADFARLVSLCPQDGQAEIVADATGVPSAVLQAMRFTKEGGKTVIVGSPRGVADGVNFYPDLHKRCIEVLGAHGDFLFSPLGERLGWNVHTAMGWLLNQFKTGRISTDGIPSHLFEPNEAPQVYDRLLNHKSEIVCAAFKWS